MFQSAIRNSRRLVFAASCIVVMGVLFSGATSPGYAQDAAPDEAEAMVRINRLENMMRQMQGQIEELQFANQKLQEQLKFMSSGTEARPPVQGSGFTPNSPSVVAAPAPASGPKSVEIPPSPAPQTAAPQSPAPQTNSGPINLLAVGKAPQPQAGQAGTGAPPMTLEQAAAAAAAGQTQQTPVPAPAQPPVEQRSNFEIAKDAMAAKDYEKAANILTGIVEGNPKEPKMADALMMLGDVQYRLKRYPEAAQRYLKLAQTYPKHPDAGLAFVRLGLSLNELGQKPQACATFAEFAKRYPSAKASVKQEADRGRKAASCG